MVDVMNLRTSFQDAVNRAILTGSATFTAKVRGAPLRSGGQSKSVIALKLAVLLDDSSHLDTEIFFPGGKKTAAGLTRLWVVNDDESDCFTMMLFLPNDARSGLVTHAHLHRIMYNGHHVMAPGECFGGDRAVQHLGDIHWGSTLVFLAQALATAADAAWLSLTDGSFVEACGGTRKILLRPLERIKGKGTFYERHGFRYVDLNILAGMAWADTLPDAHAEFQRVQDAFLARLPLCHARPASALCSRCADPKVNVYTAGQALANGLRNRNAGACGIGWDSLREDSCLWHPLVQSSTAEPFAVHLLPAAQKILDAAAAKNRPLRPLRGKGCTRRASGRHPSRLNETHDDAVQCVATMCDGSRCRRAAAVINHETGARDVYCSAHGGGEQEC